MLHVCFTQYFFGFFSGQNGVIVWTYRRYNTISGFLSEFTSNNYFTLQAKSREFAIQGVLCAKGESS